MRVHQIVVGAAPGDAVTSAALRARDALGTWFDSEVYAVHVHPALVEEVGDLRDDFPRDGSASDVTILHVSIGEPGLLDFVSRGPERLVLAYHNLTPARWFEGINDEFALRLRDGRAELPALIARADGAIADSAFNAAELRALGMDHVVVAPPPLDLDRLLRNESDEGLVESLVTPEAPLVLVVGQVLPHKRVDLAAQVHHFLNVNHLPDARLVVAGAMRQHRCSSAVVRHVESLRLDTARFTGVVSDPQLAALYRRADVLLVPSEHEGFCVPLVEAMALGVPVVARDHGAIAETAGDAGLILPAQAGAPELAEALARVLCDRALRDELVRRGAARAAGFTSKATLAGWLAAVGGLLRGAKGDGPAVGGR